MYYMPTNKQQPSTKLYVKIHKSYFQTFLSLHVPTEDTQMQNDKDTHTHTDLQTDRQIHTHNHTHGHKEILAWSYVASRICLIYVVHSISWQTFFVPVLKNVKDTWKSSMLLLYILWDHLPMFMISGLNEQIQQELEYTLLKPGCHSWWISKMQSEREDTLEER